MVKKGISDFISKCPCSFLKGYDQIMADEAGQNCFDFINCFGFFIYKFFQACYNKNKFDGAEGDRQWSLRLTFSEIIWLKIFLKL